MPVLEMKVPSPGESITEVEIAAWLVSDGDWVDADQTIAEVDSDKATLELPAEKAGIITLKAEEGDVVEVGGVVCLIDTDAKRPSADGQETPAAKVEAVAEPAKVEAPKAAPVAVGNADAHSSPVAKNMMNEHNLRPEQVNGTGANGRITKKDVLAALSGGIDGSAVTGWGKSRDERREKMSSLRRKLAQRLVAVKSETAMLTTFNEVNMKPIMDLRTKYKQTFKDTHGVGLGFMSFFTKAVTEALREFPAVNARLEEKEVVYHEYADVAIAVSSPKGLMVPVLRNAESMSLAEIEADIKRLAFKARDGKLTLDEMTGGTFTITNGGVFGSMLSTPIINPPQSAILGMHNIVQRPVAENGEVVIRPIMYVALSYDHRIIDGKESVGFLVKVKEMLEDPNKLLFGSKDPMEVLLGL
jgi:2-oxoglutarate dehydrogenase E2 component (dihydrolipoamide succinyltransferase)